MLGRIDLGDAQAEAHGGIRRRAAPLGEDAPRAREAHDVVHGEEVGRVVQGGDQRQLVVDGGGDRVRNRLPEAPARALPGVVRERLLRIGETLASFFGIIVAQIVEGEGEPVEKAQRLGHRLGRLAEQAHDFMSRLQMTLRVSLE